MTWTVWCYTYKGHLIPIETFADEDKAIKGMESFIESGWLPIPMPHALGTVTYSVLPGDVRFLIAQNDTKGHPQISRILDP